MDALHMLTPFKPKVTALHGGLSAYPKCSVYFISIKIPMQREKIINKSTSLCPFFTLFLSQADTHTQHRFLKLHILTWFKFSKKKWLFDQNL